MADWLLTEDMLAEWHSELNSICFDNVLPACTFYIGHSRDPALKGNPNSKKDGYVALYNADYVGRGTIFINPHFCRTPFEAIAAVAHEMIHQWQDLCGLRLDHRAVFQAWCQHITNLTGYEP